MKPQNKPQNKPQAAPDWTGPAMRLFWLIAAAATALDLLTKAWAVSALTALPGQTRSVIAPWLELSLTYNQGTAFSLVRDLGTARWFFGILSVAVLGVLCWMAAHSRDRLEVAALGMLAGGAIGNGWDRVMRLAPQGGTGVVDFVKVNFPWGGSWPTFNVADAWLVIGVAGLLLMMLKGRRSQNVT